MTGQSLLHYTILGKLGEGGMGVVFKAHDTRLDRDVALKFLSPGSDSVDDAARLLQEAKSAAALNHPNICTIFSIEDVPPDILPAKARQLCIAMEYVEGRTLRDAIRNSEITTQSAVEYAAQIAEAIAEAHRHSILHRDIKSENIMLNDKNRIKVMDFGLAKLRDAQKITKTASTVGTLAYLAPELFQGNDADARSDIFSLGVVMYECLAKRLPFNAAHEAALLYEIVNLDPPPVRSLRPEISPELDTIVMKCLEKDPTDRYQSAEEIAIDLRRLQRADAPQSESPKKRIKTAWMIAGVMIVLAAIGVFFSTKFSSPTSASGEDIETIAVLPFLDMSPEKDQEYFSDGLTEELLNVLAEYPQLRVTSRTSSFSFKGKNLDAESIAAKLNVRHILEGSVRKSGNQLRITTQLINVATDAHLWSETYNATMNDIFAVQDTISRSVAEALKVVLLSGNLVAKKRETQPEAYNAYLLGKHFSSRQRDLKKAERYFRQAIAIDSTFVPAWIELSYVHTTIANDGDMDIDIGYRLALQEVHRALELDPDYAEAHAMLGFIKRRYNWDWRGADESYQRALQLDPNDANIIRGAAGLARTLGRFEESVTLLQRAILLDPVSVSLRFNLGLYAQYAGDLNLARDAFTQCLELSPDYRAGHASLGVILLEMGKPDSALIEINEEAESDWKLYAQALVYHALGDRRKSDAALAELINELQSEDAFQIAEIYAYRGDKEDAFKWLERAYVQRDGGLPTIKGDRMFRSIMNDARFIALLKKLQLPT